MSLTLQCPFLLMVFLLVGGYVMPVQATDNEILCGEESDCQATEKVMTVVNEINDKLDEQSTCPCVAERLDEQAEDLEILKEILDRNLASTAFISKQLETLSADLSRHDERLKALIESPGGICGADSEPRDCADIRAIGFNVSGIYRVYLRSDSRRIETDVYCDFSISTESWLVFQRRRDGSQIFERNWGEYEQGFGVLDGEFWLGNEKLSILTMNRRYKLCIELEDFVGEKRYAEYSVFSVNSGTDKYRLTVEGYAGNAGDSLTYQNGMQFTTIDADNDARAENCAIMFHGAWWYNSCHESNLNGLYLGGYHTSFADGIECRTSLVQAGTPSKSPPPSPSCPDNNCCPDIQKRLSDMMNVITEMNSKMNNDLNVIKTNLNKVQASTDVTATKLNKHIQDLLLHDDRLRTHDLSSNSEDKLVESIYGAELGPRDCTDIRARGFTASGVYTVYPGSDDKRTETDVYCDLTSSTESWLVFQRRINGSENFQRIYSDYQIGFGNLIGEFWLGNEKLSMLTLNRRYKLRVELEDFVGEKRYAEYSIFSVKSGTDKYRLTVGGYSGNAGDSLSSQNGMQFTTSDSDNDVWGGNCAVTFHGAWWYSACHASNLNGLYLGGAHTTYADGIEWNSWHGYYYSLKATEMKIAAY